MPTREPAGHRLGAWIIGANGDIAATAIVGARALTKRIASDAGLTTILPPLDRLRLVRLQDVVFGGTDVCDGTLRAAAEALQTRSRTVSAATMQAVAADLALIEQDILCSPQHSWDPSTAEDSFPPLVELIGETRRHIRAFRSRHGLDRVVVVNLMSSLPHPRPSPLQKTLSGIREMIAADRKDLLSPSVCYAWSALSEGCPYINFTPNAGTDWGGIIELAERNRVPLFGDDGKTGETLVKTALAPMFAHRNLRVLSWEGVNLLGNADGKTLDDPRNREMKLQHKEGVLDDILGYRPHAGVTINYVPSLGDWKTAWDLIHFRGFLDVPMTMQFTWQGCDSILAAPLVLDLIRLTDFAARQGESGLMPHLAAFFKHPVGVEEMDFHRQFEMLLDYAQRHLTAAGSAAQATDIE
jgi:myo-inositol-1-phosphate synthase